MGAKFTKSFINNDAETVASGVTPEPNTYTPIIAEKTDKNNILSNISHSFIEYFEDRVFPCSIIRDKTGKKQVSLPKGWTDTTKAYEDFNNRSLNSIALRTGAGLTVIDVDTKDLTLLEPHMKVLVEKWLKDKGTFTVETTNGYHFYFDSEGASYSNGVRASEMVDIRGDGGCVFCYTQDENSTYNVVCNVEALPLSEELLEYLKTKEKSAVEYKYDENNRKVAIDHGTPNPALANAYNDEDIDKIILTASRSFKLKDFAANAPGLYVNVNKLIYILAINPSIPNDSVDFIVERLVTKKLGYDMNSPKTIKLLNQIFSSLVWTDENMIMEGDIFADAYKTPQELEKMMVDSNPILGNFVLKGQMTFIYGPPNSGKTLLLMSLLNNVYEDIVYLNADDGINGGTEKVKIAEENNYKMILCGTDNKNDPKVLLSSIEEKIKKDSNYYMNKIVLFDTVKKFVDPLNKQASAYFLQLMRKITLSGGTVVLLGHTNKHRENGELVFEGVGDWISDLDCVYSLDFENNAASREKTIIFQNHKSRGIVPETVSYKYYSGKDISSFAERIATVEAISNEESKLIKEQIATRILEEKHDESVAFIESILGKNLVLTQSDIRRLAKEDEDFIGSDKEIQKCLKTFTGIRWSAQKNPLKNNAIEYKLIIEAAEELIRMASQL